MEDKKEEGEAEIQEHGPEHWFSKWERQCLAEAEQEEALAPELQDEAAAQPEHKQQKLWHLFQNSATAVAQLYKDRVCQQPGLSLWVPFQNAATAVTNLYKESVDAHQRSFDVGIQIGYQRRNKDVLAWVKKRRRTIRREDLISFLCGKVPPPRNSRAPPRLTVVSPNRATSTETSSSVETDLQPFREAIALHDWNTLQPSPSRSFQAEHRTRYQVTGTVSHSMFTVAFHPLVMSRGAGNPANCRVPHGPSPEHSSQADWESP
ncbi:HUWE1-associated protein modifying stress responses 1 isoform X5 [Calonectris borealis]|uniref:HUWE1-associated protein modifying stress responses 1 isoform X5 n=1 Tax=Calonectris borealis TaxID=1323832 RepID=UPI003F4B2783